jgi:hypothetical protein
MVFVKAHTMAKNEIKTAVLAIRIRPSIKKLAEKLAKEQRRSVANLIQILIEQQAESEAEK